MVSNILAIPFKRTHAVSLSGALRQYISDQYEQHPDMFADDLAAVDRLRSDAVASIEAHASGIKKISAYAAQLVWLAGKFPIDIGVEFGWYPALGFNTQRPVYVDNLRFELAGVLFNLAALYSHLAVSLNRGSSEGLKAASNYLCQAAGVFDYLQTDVLPDLRTDPPEDMDLMTLEALQRLMLAQAQECSWSVAVKSGYKDALVAKLAAKVSDFYDEAAESGTRSDTISTEWLHHMSAKHHHFAAAAQYRAALDCLEKRRYGEEVARLRDSAVCVSEGLKESRWIGKAVVGDLNGLKARVVEDLKRAEKDNDMIYLMSVPPKSELKTLDRATMAVAKRPVDISDPSSSLGDRGSLGQPLFMRLVPHSVRVAAGIYAERRDRLVATTIIDELEALTDRLRDLLSSLGLPGSLQALEKPLGLPSALTAHAEEIRQQGGLHRLRRSMREVEMLKADDSTAYREGVALLQTEAAEDDKARLKYGTDRWTRQTSRQAAEHLYGQVEAIDGYLNSANSSDELVKGKLKESEDTITVLEGTDRGLEQYVPSSRKVAMPPKVEREASKLRSVINEIGRLESRRRRRIEALREKAKADDINPTLLVETARLEREFPMQRIEAVQFEDLFEKRLAKYDDDRIVVSDERDEQEHIILRLQEANAAFTGARRGDLSSRDREQALQRLESAYLQYKEIVSNVDVGRKFYNDLAKIVNRFRDDCRQFRYQRRMEANQIESDLSDAMSALSIAKTNSLQDQKERESLRSQYDAKAPTGDVLTAPTPTRAVPQPQPQPQPRPQPVASMWTPEMGIKFEAPAGTLQQQPQAATKGTIHNPSYPNTRSGRWSPGKGVMFS